MARPAASGATIVKNFTTKPTVVTKSSLLKTTSIKPTNTTTKPTTTTTTRSVTSSSTTFFVRRSDRSVIHQHCRNGTNYNIINNNNNRRIPLTTSANVSTNANATLRSLSSSSKNNSNGNDGGSSSSSSGPDASSALAANLALATVLFGFVGFVFTYSMNAVGKSDGDDDPLAQLKAEAQEARDSTSNPTLTQRKMTPEEIMALESGIGSKPDSDQLLNEDVEVAVAAPADIAALEEEANLKVFRAKQQQNGESDETKNTKPWWRFGL